MSNLQEKTTAKETAEHHAKAAECRDQAPQQHRFAAKSCTVGDMTKAAHHAKQA